ncbi:hypothetical protein H0G86_000770 [Trichoderma simmonsii]|uniref:Uncharacterized protein n=1 Tax=Trichoderma simmonsii TaxID=1491479 RepID=A0A8G0P9T7_9HYPO|nr:hypothetical protein H0G86_000770 [Trichoderma simmonsii]
MMLSAMARRARLVQPFFAFLTRAIEFISCWYQALILIFKLSGVASTPHSAELSSFLLAAFHLPRPLRFASMALIRGCAPSFTLHKYEYDIRGLSTPLRKLFLFFIFIILILQLLPRLTSIQSSSLHLC